MDEKKRYNSAIRRMEMSDIRDVAELERLCFSSPWSEKLLAELPKSRLDTCFLLDQGEGKGTAAYGILRILAGEGEIQRIGVLPSERKKGLGSKVMEAMTEYAREMGAECILLEVRESNTAARKLYKSWGFEEEGRRKNYYDNPSEDAVLMGLRCI
ncbi:ribosomal protein S18-alanine N-acetyltransferase [Clostridium sp. AM58-1XD]|uniref:ribosomal protein S18-alanine N-acetyltransferase n=1 Tax=Clostridium sp. AM58-1XD TaxID=2292307 RepID=UPI000E53ACAB|nr:ribosomal protein S18-alanine N-acetyltransferase [Clostridium sp. AM58-1XD]RGY99821.1 ribosomal-protein-alanine N-acetyltransferase [Clostridium sp. AM58-1XD]